MHDAPQIHETQPPPPFRTENPGWVKAAAALTIAIGLVVLCGWALGIDGLKRVLPGLVTMKANTAAAFVLSGICLYLQTLPTASPFFLLARRIGAALVLLLGLVTFLEYQFGWDVGIDQLLFSEPPGEILTSHPGRMSSITAANFALIGGALLLIEARLWAIAQAAALATTAFALMPLSGYIFGNLTLTHIGDTTAIAAHTVTAFLILATGVLAATRDHGLIVWLRRKSRAIGLTASLIMLVFIFGAASYNFVQKDKASQWVEHTYEALQSMEMYSDSMHDYLYHSRGFLITGDDLHLLEKDKRREAMIVEFARMHQLVSDNPAQHERLDALDNLARQRMELASLAVQTWRERGPKAVAMIFSGQGESLTVEFEAKLNELREAERKQLKEQQKTAEIIRASSLLTLGVLLAASVLLLLWAFRASQREIVEHRKSEEAMRANKDQLRLLLDSAAEAIYGIDTQGNCTFCNPSCLRMLGYGHTDELIGKNIHELIHFQHAEGTPYHEKDCPIYRAFQSETSSHADNEVFWRADGTCFPIEYWSYPQISDGKVVGAVVTFLDITERKRMEDEAAQREALFRNYFDLGQIGMAITSLEKGWLRVNDRLCEMLGYTRDELAEMTWVEMTHPDDLEPDMAQFRRLLSGEIERYSMDKRFIRKDGSIVHTYLAVSCQRKPGGDVDYVIASLQDITERKRAEEHLRISEERLALAARTGNIGIWEWDVTNNILLWDDAMYRLYGIRREDFGGAYEAWTSVLHPEDKTYVEGEIQAALRGEHEYAPEFRVVWPDGSVHYIKAASQTLYDDNGNPLRMVGINYDLTERKLAENELREKEERLALATIQNGVGVWDWNLVTQEMIWDDSMYSLYHIRREDFIGTEEAWRKALHPDDLHRGDREVNDAIAGIRPFNTEFRVVWPNGEIRHIKAVAKVFRDEQGTPLRMLGINMDITERKQAEEALRASEERLHSIIQTSMDGIVQMDADGIVSGWNSQMEKAFGWPRAEAIGQALHETIIPPQYREAHVQGLKHFLLTGEGAVLNKRVEVVGLHRDGHVFPVELTVTPIKKGRQYEFSAFLRDITERKRNENIQAARLHLMESATRLSLKELLVATLDETCALTGSTIGFYHFLEADQKTLSLQAWSTRTTQEFCKAEGEGAHYDIDQAGVWVDCVRERRPVIHNDYAALPNKRGMPPGHAHVEREMVVPIFRKDLIVAILGVGNKATPYDDNDLESVTRLADIAWGIAEAKHAEEEVRRLNAELEQRVVERTASLQAANKDLESFSYSISHDLRAPLRAINGFSKILQEDYVDRLDDEGRRLLNVVSGNAQKMGELIDDILAFSRAGRNEIVRSPIDMKKLASGVWEELKPEMAGRDLHLKMGDMPSAEGDPAMMHQIVFNLLSNAVKFTQHRADARIEVGGQADEHETVYHVKDNGVGFDMQYADKLFGVFQRLHGVDEFEGTGIGLAIVKRIVTKHGGRVWAEGRTGEGATIYFALPAGRDKGNLSSI